VSSSTPPVQYTATISPLKTPAEQGSAVPISWTLRDASGAAVGRSTRW